MAATKALYLLRHAKSSWDDPELEDHDRPLAPRGRRNSSALGEHLRREGIEPELVLCSSARRARETLARLLPALESETEIRIEHGLYAAGSAQLLARLREVPPGVASVLMVGHNPGLEDLASRLDADGSLVRLPTAALATFDVPSAWSSLREGSCRLVARYAPREAPPQR